MTKLARIQAWDRVRGSDSDSRAAGVRPLRYCAFLSYSHVDEATASWLHDALEKFRTPSSLAGRLTDNGAIPKRLTPIFRDRHELAASDNLAAGIRDALDSSRFLIVLCSPAAAASRWVNAEIDMFKRHRPNGCVLAAIVAGEPFASDVPGREGEECLPPALRQKYDRRGRPTTRRAEPLAADLREDRDGKRLGLLKLISGMLGVGLDELVQRETLRRQRRLAIVAAASLAGMAVTSTLAVVAFDARDDAREQRREAEGLVGFMLGDLREKLEPIGRLDALDAVGSRALGYYQKQDKGSLSDESLAQRSKALALLGQIASLRGDFDAALGRYREAMAGTAEMMRRAPDDPQRIFDHAQNVFAVGQMAFQRGEIGRTEEAWREYKRLADRMVSIAPNDPKWRMEVKYADANLGIVLLQQRRYSEAAGLFQRSLNTIESLAAAEPRNMDYQLSVAESLAWLADAQRAQGRLDDAIAQRERQLALLDRLIKLGINDVELRQKEIPAHQALSRLLAFKGDIEGGLDHAQAAVRFADALIPTEPDNTKWVAFAASAHLGLSELLLAADQPDAASAHTRSGCDLVNRLLARDDNAAQWRSHARQCLGQRAQVAFALGSNAEALALADQALAAIKKEKGRDPVETRYIAARIYRLISDTHRRTGDPMKARSASQTGLSLLPANVRERPWEMSERAELLRRVGRGSEAQPLVSRLEAIGFRQVL